MKLFFISDIHGSAYYMKEAIRAFEEEQADYMVILGDELYHGPRNDLPRDYNPKEVLAILNEYSNKIIAIRGNCDCDVDQMVLKFPIMSDYSYLLYENRRLFLTHGHVYNKDNMPPLGQGDVFIYGHTHIPCIERINGTLFINPGSISIPKGGFENSYGVLFNNIFTIKTFNGHIIFSESIDN
ncbi:hypothetical protein SAMN02745248_00232 [Hathewaya proteolytica DSM 3090]|uniref:Phosphoesterase n=1 Tax=Hathewaya proteolytica DSM 3090 TaxID=1121331 RepID=A0A1M6JL69_9CLOT|nr:phosphodiesterase [Hathewaya proteolytica]SHJ47423.1 hypothetical protein SAMN02745248_00232 [Hathewaya proteolytica DSM 3090]